MYCSDALAKIADNLIVSYVENYIESNKHYADK